MRKLKIVFSEEAIKDLEEIWYYSFINWSQEQADRYHSLVINEINFLAILPQSGKIITNIRKDYKSSKVKSHLIFYQNNLEVILIVRILHEAMDIPSQLNF